MRESSRHHWCAGRRESHLPQHGFRLRTPVSRKTAATGRLDSRAVQDGNHHCKRVISQVRVSIRFSGVFLDHMRCGERLDQGPSRNAPDSDPAQPGRSDGARGSRHCPSAASQIDASGPSHPTISPSVATRRGRAHPGHRVGASAHGRRSVPRASFLERHAARIPGRRSDWTVILALVGPGPLAVHRPAYFRPDSHRRSVN